MRFSRLGGSTAAGLSLAVLTAAPALATVRHSRLVPLPSVSPPTPLGQTMHWARRIPGAAPAAAADYRNGLATIGVAAGIDGASLATSLHLRIVRSLPRLRLVEVAGRPRALAVLARAPDPRIRYMEPVIAAEPAHVRNDPLTYELDPSTGTPYEWQFHAVGADQALTLSRGSPSILVGVLDSGIAPVPDLAGKIAETFWDPSAGVSALDTVGHGTFVASILAARDDDGVGMAGFCGACRLAVYKASPLTDVAVAQGIQTLTDAHVRIINLSIVTGNASQAVIDALDYATRAGVLVVAASGNEGAGAVDFPASSVQAPGGVAGTGLAVGASGANGRPASFSNHGARLSLLAPGTFDAGCGSGILGALPKLATGFSSSGRCHTTVLSVGGARYAYASGTSFAAPEVSGTAALVWAVDPSLTSVQVAGILEQTATRPPGTAWSPMLGWGVLNANAAVEAAAGKPSADTIVLADLHVSRPRRAGSKVDVTVKARWGDGTAILRGASDTCLITVRGARVRTSSRLGHGRMTCSFTLPATGGGTQAKGVVTVRAPGALATSAAFRFAIPPPRAGA